MIKKSIFFDKKGQKSVIFEALLKALKIGAKKTFLRKKGKIQLEYLVFDLLAQNIKKKVLGFVQDRKNLPKLEKAILFREGRF